MTDEPLEPESLLPDDDWSFEADAEPGAEPWAWIDEAVEAWDEPAVAEAVTTDAGELEAFDEGDSEDGPVPPDMPAGDTPAPGGEPHLGPVELEALDDPDFVGDDTPGPGDDLIGSCPVTSLVDALALAGVDDAEAIFSALDTDHLGAREAVGALDVAGVPARVEYTDLGDLLEQLEAGVEVVLGGGEPYAVVAIDPATGDVVVEPLAGGDRATLAMDAFEAAWEETANEVMVVNADSSGIQLGAGQIWVLPIETAAMMTDGGL